MKITYTLDELSQTAQHIITHSKHKTLLFDAEMGVGKTTLIKEICKQLGVRDTISSPTYSLVNEYQGEENTIYHFDFYRIQDEEEAYDIGFEEYLDTNAWVFIEWPEKISNLLPENSVKIKIELLNDGKRVLFLG
ncbi:tRNA (adenosine(37)-N6)-threonylcarbamoyltransferase complex ATPase subunit type 1 TsaE [Aquimarina sp. AD1]|uniref:tRNA (adenosine(37)-N6)-threonylcarbamoyltransferase complex ATPase subunit type 1 TsaE n=1 Tax=unclassified Aquimarina TaxID=2627091 RepID=UPI000D54C33E|nr:MULTISPECIES: tRNA (adenosine(37)-N6)-threonylcarbamoyltransferase complex ATPase subunit type 1 TsaE [unclassified Aquimarina]AXT55011.1 tRNA (adenosine(37)-N6)-threonylcarbamoyltransferase complex ATPase subunit type 1 TsaE [Aquimarina sp. AD1]RKN14188.1 tRNA (adenosine(37)-N6)-threonylcarbamoyltransferase complex ATPase subunit type 1 TsaE [Aquimarina sp. AD1]